MANQLDLLQPQKMLLGTLMRLQPLTLLLIAVRQPW
jgi:hypothetical protein